MSASSLADMLADVRIYPDELGRNMAYQPNVIQERMMSMCLGFIRELSIQHHNGGFVNGNMQVAGHASDIQYLLTTSDLEW